MQGNFLDQASIAAQSKVSILSYTLNQSWEWVAKKSPMATLVVLLGLGGGWGSEVIAPQIAQADTKRVEVSLDRQSDETYQNLLSRAEAVALSAVQQSFDQDIQMTDVSVMIMGQNQGAIAPVLFLEVSRTQWFSNPDVQRWFTYFTAARSLLGLEDIANITPQPSTPTSANTTQDTVSSPGVAATTKPNQTPTSSTGSSSIPSTTAVPLKTPDTSQNPTNPSSSVRLSVPSSSITQDAIAPATAPLNNSSTISVPNNAGIVPNNSSSVTPLIPNTTIPGVIEPGTNTSGSLNNSIPSTTRPNQNVLPISTPPAGISEEVNRQIK
jgi:hypothetical protein